MKKGRNFLLITDIVTGGEWHALLRLLSATKFRCLYYKFSLIGFGSKHKVDNDLFDKIQIIKHTNPRGRLGYFRKLINDYLKIRKAIQIQSEFLNIDYILVVDYLSAIAAYSLKKKKKIIFLFHGIRSIQIKHIRDLNYRQVLTKLLEKLTLFLSDIIIVPSEATSKYIVNYTFPLSVNKKINIIPNIVPVNYYKSVHTVFGGTPTILYSGRLRFYKGVKNLVEGFIMFLKNFPNARLLIVYPKASSENKLEYALKIIVGKNKIEKKVIFTSDPTEKDIINYYNKSHVTVLASEIENSPLSVLESLATGTPVIGTETGDMKYLLRNLDRKLLLINNSPAEIYKKLMYFFTLPIPKIKILSNRSKSIVKKHVGNVPVDKFLSVIYMLESRGITHEDWN